MRILLRVFILLLAGSAVSLLIVQLGKTAWADGIRTDMGRKNQAIVSQEPTTRGKDRQSLRPGPSYAKPFIDVGLLIGIPCVLTLGVLAVVRRQASSPKS